MANTTSKDVVTFTGELSENNKEKKVRTPRNAESILAGALKLPLIEKADLIISLKESIEKEFKEKERQAAEAKTALDQL